MQLYKKKALPWWGGASALLLEALASPGLSSPPIPFSFPLVRSSKKCSPFTVTESRPFRKNGEARFWQSILTRTGSFCFAKKLAHLSSAGWAKPPAAPPQKKEECRLALAKIGASVMGFWRLQPPLVFPLPPFPFPFLWYVLQKNVHRLR